MKIDERIRNLEDKLISHEIRKSAEELSQLINDEFIEIGGSGKAYNKKQVMESLKNESPQKIIIDNFKTLILSEDVIAAIYIAIKENGNSPKSFSRRCSIWKRKDGKWQIYYHQGTNINQPL